MLRWLSPSEWVLLYTLVALLLVPFSRFKQQMIYTIGCLIAAWKAPEPIHALVFGLTACLPYCLSKDYDSREEVLSLYVGALLGWSVVVRAEHFLMLYLGLELLSFPCYALLGLSQMEKRAEACMKVFVQSAVVGACFLFVLSWIYGLMGSLAIESLRDLAAQDVFWQHLCSIGLFGVVLFKLGLVPIHFWVPDVYEQAPLGFLVFWSLLPKVAMLMVAQKFSQYLPKSVEILRIAVISSAIIGPIAAYHQRSMQRFLGYASIGHMALVVAPLAVGSTGAMGAMVFAVVSDAASLFMLSWGFREEKPKKMLVFLGLLNLAGLPPLPGFFAKVSLLNVLIEHQAWGLALFLSLSQVVTLAYYAGLMIEQGLQEESSLQEVKPKVLEYISLSSLYSLTMLVQRLLV